MEAEYLAGPEMQPEWEQEPASSVLMLSPLRGSALAHRQDADRTGSWQPVKLRPALSSPSSADLPVLLLHRGISAGPCPNWSPVRGSSSVRRRSESLKR